MTILKLLPQHIIKRFTRRAREALERCEGIAHSHPIHTRGGITIDVLHLFYSLFRQKGTMAHNIIVSHNIKEKEILEALRDLKYTLKLRPETMKRTQETMSSRSGPVLVSESLKRSLKKAAVLAASNNHTMLGTEHLLWGLLDECSPSLKPDKLRDIKRHLRELLKNNQRFPDFKTFMDTGSKQGIPRNASLPEHKEKRNPRTTYKKSPSKKGKESPLTYFCNDLTQSALRGTLAPLIGRKEEVKRLIRILSRHTKNNPLLLGEPGVGKTAIIEGLAQKIAAGEVPEHLLHKRIYALDLGLLVAGTIFRGEFESRIKDLLEELKESRDILFIDEFHNIIGAGSAQGTLDAANILKPMLSTGELQCIGATTEEEYQRYVEKDSALERRLQPMHVKEPTKEDTIKILTGLKPFYEKHFHITIQKQAITTAVELASRYIQDRFLPDKAIDVLDEAASELVSRLASPRDFKVFKLVEQEYQEIKGKKERAIKNERYEDALRMQHKEKYLGNKLNVILDAQTTLKSRGEEPVLTSEDVTALVADLTGIPLGQLTDKQEQVFSRLEHRLSRDIVGQPEAVKKVSATLKRARVSLNDPKRPLGSFIFLGPTGVGKTELAKALARALAPSAGDMLIKLDMAEFSEPHTISKIIGAPPGYVGYEEGSKILERLRRNPFSVILLDEIEKAHPNIYNVLLEMLEDGEITTGAGKKVNLKNTVIIMTSNIGTEEFTNEAALGFQKTPHSRRIETKYKDIEARTKKELKKVMRPELLNRIDSVLVFKPLGQVAIERIVRLRLKELRRRTVEYKLTFSKEVARFISEKAFNPEEGARLVRRVIEERIESPLADLILEGTIKEGNVMVGIKKGEITFKN